MCYATVSSNVLLITSVRFAIGKDFGQLVAWCDQYCFTALMEH